MEGLWFSLHKLETSIAHLIGGGNLSRNLGELRYQLYKNLFLRYTVSNRVGDLCPLILRGEEMD